MATANDLNISQPGYVAFDGVATFTGRTFQAGTGITLTNASGVAGNTTIATTASLTDLHAPRFIVASSTAGTGANFTSIASAIAAAQGTGVKSTVFIQPGTYTENLTLVPNINLCAFECDSSLNATGVVQITGKLSFSTAGTATISGIQLNTNADNFLAVTGSAASIVNLNNCYLNCSNNTGISFTTSNTSSQIIIDNCNGNLGTTGIALHSMSSTGNLIYNYCQILNSGSSTTASSNSAGGLFHSFCQFQCAFSCSGSGTASLNFTNYITNVINTTSFTTTGTGISTAQFCYFLSGTASGISVGTGTTVTITNCNIFSSNTNAITGAGSLNTYATVFSGSSHLSNVTTQTGAAAWGLTQGSAPSQGGVGEQIKSAVTAVSVVNTTPKTIASISIPPGIWDLVGQSRCLFSIGGALTSYIVSISTTTNVLGSGAADALMDLQNITVGAAGILSSTVAGYRVTLSATTTYYLVCEGVFVSGTGTADGRISATRVG